MGRIVSLVLIVITALLVLIFFIGNNDSEITFSKQQQTGPFHLVFSAHRGPYSNAHSSMGDVCRGLLGDTIKGRGFALYYDDPAVTPPESLRYIAGCITDSLLAVQDPWRSGTIRTARAIVGEVSKRNYFSYTIGVSRLYPRLKEFLKTDTTVKPAGPVLEMFDEKARTVRFIVPLDNSTFTVPSFTGGKDKPEKK